MDSRSALLPLAFCLALSGGLAAAQTPKDSKKPAATTNNPAKAREAQAFLKQTNSELKGLQTAANRADWVKNTYITEDTEAMSAAADARLMEYRTKAIKKAVSFDGLSLPAEQRRQLELLKRDNTTPAPDSAAKIQELAGITSRMTGIYGRGKVCQEWTRTHPKDANGDQCLDLEELTQIMAESRKASELLAAWEAWHSVAPPLQPLYERYVALTNEGARELHYDDVGEIWRSSYDMSPEAFEKEMERLWQQVRPLYEDLHCYVKDKLAKTYSEAKNPEGYLPAHLLGNMWAQEWTAIYPLVEPFPGQTELDVTKALQKKNYDAVKLTKLGENFFTSLGLKPLPESFYERSMLVKPRDREVVCHASAWDITLDNDVRIKMCIQIDEENMVTVHHELGHIYYFQYYHQLPALYQQAAHDGFHEAIGDTIALSVNPSYLSQVGILDEAPPANEKATINILLKKALEKVAFLPFGYLMDKWRWEVFSGKTTPATYNSSWWKLREKYQGISAPAPRPADAFDAGAKFHIPANTPYARYFLADILQFQLHRSLCQTAGHKGPLSSCSIYGNKAAGEKLRVLLELGASRPWPEALKLATGEDKMDASAILDYFAPLSAYLKEQNKGKTCSWPQ